MPDSDDPIRGGLERLSDPGEARQPLTLERLAARRRRRRIRNAVLITLPIVVALGLVGSCRSTPTRSPR
jgi:hypothetical protein